MLAKSLRPPPDKHHGLADVETRYRRRELDLMANEEARELFIARAQDHHRDPPLPRRRAASSRSRRRCSSRSTAARWRGRSRRTTTRWTRHVPADRHRALPQAAASSAASSASTSSARTSATRACRPSTTPSSRCSSGTRPTPTTATRRRGSSSSSPSAAAAVGYEGELDFAPPWRRVTLRDAILERDGHRHPRATATASRSPRRSRDAARRDRRPDLAAARRRTALQARRAELHPADVHHRLPGRALAVRQAPPRPRRGSSSASRRSSAAWRSPTPSPSSTTPTSSARASRRRRGTRLRATTRRSPTTRPSSGARAGHVKDPPNRGGPDHRGPWAPRIRDRGRAAQRCR